MKRSKFVCARLSTQKSLKISVKDTYRKRLNEWATLFLHAYTLFKYVIHA